MNAVLRACDGMAYLRTGAAATPRRLLVLAHGVGGNETNLLPLAQQVRDDTAVLLPRGPLERGPSMHAWFDVSFGPDGPKPDFIQAEWSRARLAAFVAGMQAELGVASERTVIAGFSQGGIMSASVALTRPQLVAGFGILAGRILPELEPQLADRAALARLQGFVGHGRHDTKLPPDWAQRSDAWLTRLGIAHETRFYDGDHGLPPPMREDFVAWFDRVTST